MAHPKSIHCASDCFADIYRGISIPQVSLGYLCAFFTCGFALVWLFPTSQALTLRMRDVQGAMAWFFSGALLFCIVLLAIVSSSHHTSEFIYFNF
jgi:hypothetical protein